MKLSIIIPTLNEQECILATLESLQPLRSIGHELIVVDAGSTDKTIMIAEDLSDKLLLTDRGRAIQMNLGATTSHGDVLVFLHADTSLPRNADSLIVQAVNAGALWGRFDIKIEGHGILLRIIERAINLRSRLTGIATGDQAIWARNDFFHLIGTFPEIPIMEDVAISAKMKSLARPVCLREKACTSGRRWLRNGVIKTMLLMWGLRLAYTLRVPPRILSEHYYGQSRQQKR